MISFAQFLTDLANPNLGFLLRAVVISVVSAVACAVVGCFVVLRGMAFIGDAISHAVFPGITIAFALQVSVLAGGAVAGAVVAVLIAAFAQRKNLREDSIIGIFFAASFALGMVIISRVDGYTASLSTFLFGSLTGVSWADVTVSSIVAGIVVCVLVAVLPQLVACCLDRETAHAMGLPVLALDMILYLAVTAAVVISVSTIGNILVLALLITPAATARLITNNLKTMMVIAPLIGALGSFTGIYLAWAIDLPAGATIVLTLTAIFFLTWAFSGKRALAAALAGLITIVPMATGAPTATAAPVITHGHQDLAVLSDGTVGIIDDVSGTTLPTATFQVTDRKQLPAELGGGEGYVLPQTQIPDQPWVGFSTTEYPMNSGDVVRIRMRATGPGHIIAWQTQGLGGYTTIFDSRQDLHWDLPPHTHAHTGFIFSAPGTYPVTFTYELPTGAVKELPVTFAVGSGAEAPTPTSSAKPTTTTTAATLQDPVLNTMNRELTALNSALGGFFDATIAALTQAVANLNDQDTAPQPSAAAITNAPTNATTTEQTTVTTTVRQQAPAPAPVTVTATKQAPKTTRSATTPRATAKTTTTVAPHTRVAAPVEIKTSTPQVAATTQTSSTMDFVAGVFAGVGGFAFMAGLVLLGYSQGRKRSAE